MRQANIKLPRILCNQDNSYVVLWKKGGDWKWSPYIWKEKESAHNCLRQSHGLNYYNIYEMMAKEQYAAIYHLRSGNIKIKNDHLTYKKRSSQPGTVDDNHMT